MASSIGVLDVAPITGGHLTPFLRSKLAPEYVKMYDESSAGKPQVQERPPRTFRMPDGLSYFPGQPIPVPVHRELDLQIPRKYTDLTAPKVGLRIFWPPSSPGEKLPCFLHIHGGGWVLGSKGSEIYQCTTFCIEARCVVVTVDYRLAPEDPFPACVEDCWETLQWIVEDARSQDGGILGVDDKRVAIGGASAGGNLAAVMGHMCLSAPHAPIDFEPVVLLLTIPAVDFTASDPTCGTDTWDQYPSWTEMADAPALPAVKLIWYRNLYLPNPTYRTNWHASPIFAPKENFARLPKTHVTTAECDPLRDEGLVYSKLLKAHGVDVTYVCYKGMPHPAIASAGLLKVGEQWQKDLCKVLHDTFY